MVILTMLVNIGSMASEKLVRGANNYNRVSHIALGEVRGVTGVHEPQSFAGEVRNQKVHGVLNWTEEDTSIHSLYRYLWSLLYARSCVGEKLLNTIDTVFSFGSLESK